MTAFRTIFGCDPRGLALFRIGLGSILIIDLLSRAHDLTAHYSDFGILPRVDLLTVANEWRPSIHLMSGSAKIQACLLIVAGVIALALVVGYRTRIATALSWVLLLSLHTRNELILHGAGTPFSC